MTDIDFTPEDEGEDDTYDPVPQSVDEGCALLADPYAFFEKYNGDAAMMFNGNLLVLDRETRQWVNVCPPDKAKSPRATLKGVP